MGGSRLAKIRCVGEHLVVRVANNGFQRRIGSGCRTTSISVRDECDTTEEDRRGDGAKAANQSVKVTIGARALMGEPFQSSVLQYRVHRRSKLLERTRRWLRPKAATRPVPRTRSAVATDHAYRHSRLDFSRTTRANRIALDGNIMIRTCSPSGNATPPGFPKLDVPPETVRVRCKICTVNPRRG